jgi:hypothetical protein
VHKVAALLLLVTFCFAGTALANADLDNNGIIGDETFTVKTFTGTTDLEETVIFPTSADTWQMTYYPYWWNYGDTVYGVHDCPLDYVNHADIHLKLSYNILTSGVGFVYLDFRIDGVTVGSFTITAEHGTGYVDVSFDFAPMYAPFELRYFETNSVSMDESGLSSVTFLGGVTPAAESSWSEVKALYR